MQLMTKEIEEAFKKYPFYSQACHPGKKKVKDEAFMCRLFEDD